MIVPSRNGSIPQRAVRTRIRLLALRADGRTLITDLVARDALLRPTSQSTRIDSCTIDADRTAR